jgi:hypothetical protein
MANRADRTAAERAARAKKLKRSKDDSGTPAGSLNRGPRTDAIIARDEEGIERVTSRTNADGTTVSRHTPEEMTKHIADLYKVHPSVVLSYVKHLSGKRRTSPAQALADLHGASTDPGKGHHFRREITGHAAQLEAAKQHAATGGRPAPVRPSVTRPIPIANPNGPATVDPRPAAPNTHTGFPPQPTGNIDPTTLSDPSPNSPSRFFGNEEDRARVADNLPAEKNRLRREKIYGARKARMNRTKKED